MNKDRRKQIAAVAEQIGKLKGDLDSIIQELETIRDDEQEYLDAMPESLQQTEKGEIAENAIENLEEAISELGLISLDEAEDALARAAE